MADDPLTTLSSEYINSVNDYADDLFCKMSLALIFGELAKSQGSREDALEFLESKKKALLSFGDKRPESLSPWDTIFELRFQQNVDIVFGSINVGPDNK